MVGQSLGRYTIESKLGEGGMGVVFKARDRQLGRAVAIKILPPDKVADPDRKRRFTQGETVLISQLMGTRKSPVSEGRASLFIPTIT